jgi:serine protease Do
MKKSVALVAVLLIVVSCISGMGGAILGVTYYSQFAPTPEPQTIVVQATDMAVEESLQVIDISNTQIENDVTRAVEDVGPAVVTVVGTITGQVDFFGRVSSAQTSGSGVVISRDGYVLTNNHVVEGAQQLTVILNDGTEYPAEVINTDIFADLAVLSTNTDMPVAAPLGNSDNLKPGETVIAIGSPLGDFRNTVTVGVISATNRSLDTGNGYQMEGLIQTDAAINQGNSGGPLINIAGEVIGINTLVVRGSGNISTVAEGLGFAVPSNTAALISAQIIEKGYFARPYLGVSTQTISPAINHRYNLGTDYGEYIMEVGSNSPAERGGLQPGDIITKIGDLEITENNPFVNILYTFSPNEVVPVVFMRDNQLMQATITLGEVSVN